MRLRGRLRFLSEIYAPRGFSTLIAAVTNLEPKTEDEMPVTKNDPLAHVRGTSSGTLASLIESPLYADIDRVQGEWYNWLLDEAEKHDRVFDNWVTAWNAWVAETEQPYRVFGEY